MPILQLELGAARTIREVRSNIGLGDAGRPLLSQRIVRRQLLYMDRDNMTESQAWKRVRIEFNDEIEAFRYLIRREDVKEDLAAALTADVTSLTKAHRIWVDTLTAKVTGFNPIAVHFRSVQSDGLPTLRELLLKTLPRTNRRHKPTYSTQALLMDSFQYLQGDDIDEYKIIFDVDKDAEVNLLEEDLLLEQLNEQNKNTLTQQQAQARAVNSNAVS